MSALPDIPIEPASALAATDSPLNRLASRCGADVLGTAVLALSRFVGEHRNQSMGDVYNLNTMLLRYSIVRRSPSGLVDVPKLGPVAAPRSAMRIMGLRRSDLSLQWNDAVGRDGVRATLPMDVLTGLFSVEVIEALCALIVDGPGVSAEHLERVLHLRALEEVPATRARPDGGQISLGTIKVNVTPVRAVMHLLVDLNRRQVPCKALAQWQGVPKTRLPRAAPANTNRSAPDLRLVRQARAALDQEVKTRLNVDHDADELPRVQTMSAARLESCAVWRLSRTRAMLDLAFVLGGRVNAVCELRRRDLVRDHEHLDKDSGRTIVGPAIALRPGKTQDKRKINYKPIQLGLLRSIEVYLTLTDRLIAEASSKSHRQPRPAPGPDAPLWIGRLTTPDKAITSDTFYQQLAGRKAYPQHNQGARKPLLPRGDGNGFSPQALRRASLQSARIAALDYCRGRDMIVTSEMISEALLDHDMPADRYGYADVNTDSGREGWSGVATKLNWEMLTGDRGARWGLDHERIDAAERWLAELRSEADRRQRQIDELHNEAMPTQLTAETFAAFHQAADRKAELRLEIDRIMRELHGLRHDPSKRIPVPDDVPDTALESPRPREEVSEDASQVLRDWVTGPEFPVIYDISRAQGARWAKGEHLPHRHGDPRRPFEPEGIPVDRSLGPRRARYWVGGLNAGSLSTDLARERLRQLLTQLPKHWSPEQCAAPLELPEPFASVRGDAPEPQLGFLA